MLLTIFAFGIGCAIGRLRGGSASGMGSAQFRRPGLLVLGVTTVMILNVIGPAFPIMWGIIGTIAFFAFGLRNLQLTGMIVMLIGLLMNTAPMLANGAMPVSELALISVGDIDDSGHAKVDGLRESTDTATTFAAFGDVIPVPAVNAVVSIGDVVMLVALADIAANLFLRSRRREELDRDNLGAAGVSYADEKSGRNTDRPAVLSPLNIGVSNRPAHALHRRPRRKAAPSTHVPAHAKQSDFFDLTDPAAVIVLDGADGYVESGAPKKPLPKIPTTEITIPAETKLYDEEAETPEPKTMGSKTMGSDPQATPAKSTNEPATPERSSRSDRKSKVANTGGSPDNKAEFADRRPIIDLTESPTDEQLQEFLRRRVEADAEYLSRTSPGPRRRRGRAPRRTAEVAKTTR